MDLARSQESVEAKLANPKMIALLESIVDLMLDKGFHKSSVRDIAEAANINMATLYTYVSDKHELLFYMTVWLSNAMNDEFDAMLRLSSKSATDDLYSFTRTWITIATRHSKYIRFSYRELASMRPEHTAYLGHKHRHYIDLASSIITRGVGTGEFRDMDADIAAAEVVFLGHFWALRAWTLSPGTEYQKFLDTTVDFILAGITSR